MIRLGVAGLGRWGQVLIDAVQDKSDRVRVTHAITRDPAAARAGCAPRGIVPVATLAEAFPHIDGMVLATPHSLHAEQIAACAAARVPVFVEKPVTLTLASAETALAAARAAGIPVCAGFNRRFAPAMQALKALVDGGDLGTVLHVETHFSANVAGRYTADMWRVAPGESPAGGLAGMGIHMIDAILHLAGPIAEVSARSARLVLDVPMDDTTMVTFGLASGAGASLVMVTATAPLFRIQVLGSKGRAEITGPDMLQVVPLVGAPRTQHWPDPEMERAELEAFADAIAGKAPYPVSESQLLNGVAAFEAVSAALAARAPVALP
jgi:predicted dehydrogenase